MAQPFTLKNSHIAVFITVLLAAFLGACYFFIYVPDNEKTVQERYFRCLENIAKNVGVKVENSSAQINALLDAKEKDPQAFNNYVSRHKAGHFSFVKVPQKKEYNDPGAYVDINQSTEHLSVYVVRGGKHAQKIGMMYDLREFINPLLPDCYFKNYIVFDDKDKDQSIINESYISGISHIKTDSPQRLKNGINNYIVLNDRDKDHSIIYESFPIGLSYVKADSLVGLKNGIRLPSVRALNIGGKDYEVFSQSVAVSPTVTWVIAGFVDGKGYQSEKGNLPLTWAQLLLTLGIVIVTMFPWIKLFHMGNKDKLTVYDGTATVLVSMLLMSLLIFVVFKYNILFFPEGATLHNKDHGIPSQIISAFENDLIAANTLLTKYDQSSKTSNQNKVKLVKDNTAKNIDVAQVSWLDENGDEKANWTADNVNAPHSNYNQRNYFKNVSQNQFNWTGDGQFYIDQVISRASNEFTSVIAKRSTHKEAKVVGMTFTAKSIDNAIIPDGYQFAIIDRNSTVLYDSDTDRNLNEKLTDKFTDSTKLVGAIAAKSDTGFEASYYGDQYDVRIKAFDHLPYFVVVMRDHAYQDSLDTESYSFTITMTILLILFLVIQVSVVFFASSKRSVFKKQHFETSWIGPKISSHRYYTLSIIFNSLLIALLTCLFYNYSFLTYLFILLFAITASAMFQNFVFLLKYIAEGKKDYKYFKIIAILWLAIFIGLIDFAAYHSLDEINFNIACWFEAKVLLLVILIGVIGHLIFKNRDQNRIGPAKKRRFWNHMHSYAVMTTTNLVITSGIPIGFFFIFSYNFEQNLDARYQQVDFAQSLTKKLNASGIKYTLTETAVYPDGDAVRNIAFVTNRSVAKNPGEKHLTAGMLTAPRLKYNNLEIRNNYMTADSIDTNTFFVGNYRDKSSFVDSVTTFYRVKGGFIRISSGPLVYANLTWKFWLVISILMVTFYYIIMGVIRKLFALNLPVKDGWDNMNKELLFNNKLNSLLFVLGSPGSAKLKMITGILKTNGYTADEKQQLLDLRELNDEDKINKKLKQFNEKRLIGPNKEPLFLSEDLLENNVFIADMILISAESGEADVDWQNCRTEALKDSYSLIIIDHFEYNIKNDVANQIKLNFLETLLQKTKSKVMIISTIHPINFLDSFQEDQDGQDGGNGVKAMPGSELERWQVLLGHFRIAIEPLSDITKTRDERIRTSGDQLERAILEETRYSHYLNNLYDMSIRKANAMRGLGDDLDDVADSVIFKLQITSHYFYTYIWQSLTKEEKFLLYDLAEDGLVNPFDDYNLSMLISKGLIIRPEGTLQLFNKGFRNYILTSIGNSEVNRLQEQVKDNGNWSSLKIPLIIALVAIVVFFVASRQEAYTKILTYVTAIGAGVPAILKLFSLFPSKGTSTQKTD